MERLKEALNKDVKEYNLKLLILSGILFITLMGFISYKLTNSSYALFTDTVTGTKTLTLHYEAPKTVTFNPDGGTIPEGAFWTGSGTTATKEVTRGLTYGDLPEPIKEGYTFKGWNGNNLFNPDAMVISNTTHVIGSEEISFNAGVYDRILSKESWTPKTNTTYTMVIEILENTFNQNVSLRTDERFYIENYNNTSSYNITAGNTDKHVLQFKKRNDFSNVTLGSFWFNTANTVSGQFKVNIAVYEGTTATNYEPYFITEDTKVVQTTNHTLKAIWEENENQTND